MITTEEDDATAGDRAGQLAAYRKAEEGGDHAAAAALARALWETADRRARPRWLTALRRHTEDLARAGTPGGAE